ncbi:MAG: tetratricopeptide repeat protein [Vampirovibrionales bacterium]|nr:tetratricopeptide repeat protein [Vampirovibrionales bacterium]
MPNLFATLIPNRAFLQKISMLALTGLISVFVGLFVTQPVFAQSKLLPGKVAVEGYPNILDNAIEHNRQGTSLMKLERFLEAAEHFQAAIKLNPYSAMAAPLYNNLGIAYFRLGYYPLAVASFQYALRIQPDFNAYYQNIIDSYIKSNALADAQAELQEIVAENPEDAEAYYLLALIYQERDEIELADLCLAEFRKLKPHSALSNSLEQKIKRNRK